MGSQENALRNCCISLLSSTFIFFLLFTNNSASQKLVCHKSRQIFSQPWGEISDSDGATNYTKDSHCEWLIRAENSSQFITLKFRSIYTECAYDYIFVFDGDSYEKSILIGSFSGKTQPNPILASSGSMLILLYSDTNYVLDGFRADYSITNCPNNCSMNGKCINHKCICMTNWIGDDCSKNSCPENCYEDAGHGKCMKEFCQCNPGYTGQSCSLKFNNPISNEYHWVSDFHGGLQKRAGHTAIYEKKTDSLYVFGGYNLNEIIDSHQIYRFDKSQWEHEFGIETKHNNFKETFDKTFLRAVLHNSDETSSFGLKDQSLFKNILLSISENDDKLRRVRSTKFNNITINSDINEKSFEGIRPSARFGHAASNVEDGYVIYGGKTVSGKLSDELWFFNVSASKGLQWSLRATKSKIKPPFLVWHTITKVKEHLYLFGGSTVSGDFSSRMFKIKLSNNISEEQWIEVKCRGGKSLDVRVVAHTTVYYEPLNSLLVYGGITTSVARFSKLSDKMFAFNLDTQYWVEILYPRTYLRDSYVPRERAFHTSVISGNYLIVFGGYSHRHNKEEICYDNQMYLYHLGCHTWTSIDVLGTSTNHSRYPKQQGVFAHASALRENVLLIVGGYHGTVNSDFIAYTIPEPIYESDDPESKCHNYQQNECLSNTDCGWCSSDNHCYGRTVGANCTTNLQTTRCPGICNSLGDCQSCLILGKSVSKKQYSSVAQKLGLDKCTWCVQNARCHHKDDYGVCGEDTEDIGWWGKMGIEISDFSECTQKDKPAGLTLLRYLYPVNYDMPDQINIINATMVDFNLPATSTQTEHLFNGEIVTRLLGYIRLPETWKNLGEKLWVCSSYSQTELKIGMEMWNTKPLKLAANISSDKSTCIQADWKELEPGKIFIDLQAKRTMTSHNQAHSKIGLQHNRTNDSARAFTFEYLEPFANETCNFYSNCLHCLSSSSCAWCDLTDSCVSRNLNHMESCKIGEDFQYLTLHSTKCKNCSNFISCEECLNVTNNCEWWLEDAKCSRRGRSIRAIKKLKECPSPCYQRNDCNSCLGDPGRCVWCKSSQKCFSFSTYTSDYQFGMCREWLDQVSYITSVSQPETILDGKNIDQNKCRSCSYYTNCSSCLKTLNCGWCYDKENPINGICLKGDFNTSSLECSFLLNKTNVEFNYAQCPDVDECELEIHDCHKDAKCTNTHGSYQCECHKGFIGDGKKNCTKTCFEKCIHGFCSGPPTYNCNCHLGWTGQDCSINCGCNNHSTCSKGVGICDECQEFTEGIYCERCRSGSYGNATDIKVGCTSCDCNLHGNLSLGICDNLTGECFCQDNTGGMHCEICNSDYYGDPSDGGQCYLECGSRSILPAGQKQGLGSYQSFKPEWGGSETRECLWIISPMENNLQKGDDYIVRFEIDKIETNVSCDRNAIYIYDGLPDLAGVAQKKQLIAVLCNEDPLPKSIEGKSGHLTVFYKQSVFEQGFNAVFYVHSCQIETCKNPYVCDKNGKCVCPEGFTGSNCSTEICPKNCYHEYEQGICDLNYGRCICKEGFGDIDCSKEIRSYNLIFTELFNSLLLSNNFEHLRKTIPRFGHTLVCDRRSSLWMFGGYSMSIGPLNDIRQFDTKNNTWLQVTVDFLPEDKMPEGRYFHSSEIVSGKQAIYIYGGISEFSEDNKMSRKVLGDFWKFSLLTQRWEVVQIEDNIRPPPLCMHTLTFVKDNDKEFLILIGGFSFESGFNNDVWAFNLSNSKWIIINTKGPISSILFGHTTVYHSISQSLYIYGGYRYEKHKTVISNKLSSFNYVTSVWSDLPSFNELNRPNQLRGRFGHSAVSTDTYMVVYGGRTSPHNGTDILIAYNYLCNQWIKLTEDTDIIGQIPTNTYSHAMTIDDSNSIYIVAGWDGSINGKVIKINIPSDICSLWSRSKYMCRHIMGCSFCAAKPLIQDASHCYSNGNLGICKSYNTTLIFNSGATCDNDWIQRRNCSSFTTCSSCLASWPMHSEKTQICQWFQNGDGKSKCVSTSLINCTDNNCDSITDIEACPNLQCSASDCNSCNRLQNCVWVFDGQSHQCMNTTLVVKKKVDIIGECPTKCNVHKDCFSCLRGLSSEGGFDECLWSTELGICFSQSYQPVVCSGGLCGLILTSEEKNFCPEPCEAFDQCQKCLRHAHCGWCSKLKTEGDGICTQGSMTEHPNRATCDLLYAEAKNVSLKETDVFSWNYVKCPPENECANGHHSCNPESEECFDLNYGYKCNCKEGFRFENGKCIAICTEGCVRGTCIAPNICKCDFGYVGVNCTIQCNCNGNAQCAGPDKLDECDECHNNTMGFQCEKCKKWFVKNEKNECIPCLEFCNGHSEVCLSKDFAIAVQNLTKEQIDDLLTEGVQSDAVCLGCKNMTDGSRCSSCVPGFFRGTLDTTNGCRPCECNGHGELCDPVTGEKCNCANNTESDLTCSAKSHKNSVYCVQCSKCKDSYAGHPTNSHQCYKQITVESKMCFDAKTIDECKVKPKALNPGETVFFVVQPRFMNVDIRIIVDVTQGELSFFMSNQDDSFVVETNKSSGYHEIYLDHQYKWILDESESEYFQPISFSPEKNKYKNLSDDERIYLSPAPDCKTKVDGFFVQNYFARDLCTYITLLQCNTLMRVFGLKNRLVVTLPQNIHNLSGTRFFIAIRATGEQTASYGLIFFRQDQLHIDLFVFFSVFFSCFFLFLAVCVVAWKFKQAADMRRARRRHNIELIHMAQRPFSTISVNLGPEQYTPSIQNNRRRKSRTEQLNRQHAHTIAQEFCSDGNAAIATVFVRLPGRKKAPINLAMGSTLISTCSTRRNRRN